MANGIMIRQRRGLKSISGRNERKDMRAILFILVLCISLLYLYRGITNAVCKIGDRETRFIDVAYPALSVLSIVVLMITEKI